MDPFNALRKAWRDRTILLLCATVFLSYLPEAGQYSCFFVYLRLVMDFSKESVAMFIAAIGILSVVAQTGLLTLLMKVVGSKHTIMIGLLFEMLQLMWYGFGSQTWMMWAAGVLAAVSRSVLDKEKKSRNPHRCSMTDSLFQHHVPRHQRVCVHAC